MTADILRRAAAKLRETTAKTTPGPWEIRPGNNVSSNIAARSVLVIDGGGWSGSYNGKTKAVAYGAALHADAAWIALASPVIAEPLAAWLEATAARLERQALAVWHESAEPHAFAVARAVLGEETSR